MSPTKANDQATLDVLRRLGVELVPLELPAIAPGALRFVLTAEGAAAFDELTYREAATELGVPVGTVMSRLFYARKRLQTLLRDVYETTT